MGGRGDALNASVRTRGTAAGWTHGMRLDRTLGMAANCGMECAEQDHVAGGKKTVCTFPHTKGDGITTNFRK
ncbi:MAG: hypothetical protein IKJ45_06045 [Kiritimatiellae bacterium]|nr:hypothetical protein [Kiritimatiellia bacterium]MBR3922655.1 hypothetical protein [Kiritimatiellia bacterium]